MSDDDYSVDSLSDFDSESDLSDIDNIDDIKISKKSIKKSKKNIDDDIEDLDYSVDSDDEKPHKKRKTKIIKLEDETNDEDQNEDEDEDDDDDENDNEDDDEDENEDDEDDENDNEDDDIENFDDYDDNNEDEDDLNNKINIINDEETIMTNKSLNTIVDKDKYISRPILTIYEYTKIICKRTTQILEGAKIMLNIPESEIHNYTAKELAILELKYKVSPFKIIRTIGKNNVEIWNVNELKNNFI